MRRFAAAWVVLALCLAAVPVRADEEVVLSAAGFAGGTIEFPRVPPNLGERAGLPPAASPAAVDEHLAMGKPSAASTSPEDFLMEKPQYALSYNDKTHIP